MKTITVYQFKTVNKSMVRNTENQNLCYGIPIEEKMKNS